MSTFEVVVTPIFGKADSAWLETVRQKWAHSFGPPSFTLVFPGTMLPQGEFVGLIEKAIAGTRRIAFCLRSAMVVPDPQVSVHHVFLMPDEGFGAIVRLHRQLHRVTVAAPVKRRLSYLPHLTVASLGDAEQADHIADDLNAADFEIKGQIDEIVIHKRDGEVVRSVATIPLVKPGLFGG